MDSRSCRQPAILGVAAPAAWPHQGARLMDDLDREFEQVEAWQAQLEQILATGERCFAVGDLAGASEACTRAAKFQDLVDALLTQLADKLG
jgi:hypothetical protein